MLCTDDACIVSQSPQELAKMMEVTVQVRRAFSLTVSAKKTKTMCMPPPHKPRTMVRVEVAGKMYVQFQSFTYRRGAVTEAPDLCELYDQPNVALSIKTRMVKAEAIEAIPHAHVVRGPFARKTTPNSALYTTGSYFASSGHSARD